LKGEICNCKIVALRSTGHVNLLAERSMSTEFLWTDVHQTATSNSVGNRSQLANQNGRL